MEDGISGRVIREFAAARWLHIACATGALGLGLLYLRVAAAPRHYLLINLAALVVGLALYAAIVTGHRRVRRASSAIPLGIGLILLSTALFGASMNGAARWIRVGPITLQPSLVLVPALMLVYAERPERTRALGVALAALALALQPDRAMAFALAAAASVVALRDRSRLTLGVLAAALAAFMVTLFRSDLVPPAAHVEGVVESAFAVGPFVGMSVLAGLVLLLVPAVAHASQTVEGRARVVFAATWLAAIAAALLGNYPTPVVGYGASGVLGYVISLAFLSAASSATDRPPLGGPLEGTAKTR